LGNGKVPKGKEEKNIKKAGARFPRGKKKKKKGVKKGGTPCPQWVTY